MQRKRMTVENFCRVMGFGNAEKNILEKIWDELLQSAPAGVPDFMTMDFCRKYYPLTGGAPEHLKRMEKVCEIVRQTPEAALYAWILHYGIFLRTPQINMGAFPLPTKVFGENAGIFQLMFAVSAIPLIEKTMTQMNIPVSYAHDIAKWIGGTIQIFEAGNQGIPGHTLQQSSWIRHYINGELFRIGRFEYFMHEFPAWVPAVYRNKKDGSLMVFCRDGWRFLPDGKRPPAGSASPDAVVTRLKIMDGHATGIPIAPDGKVLLHHETSIDLSEWEPVCQSWDITPSIHIPAGGHMTPELAKQSMQEAKVFFRKYLGQDVKMFVCYSWILNPDWETELPESNLAKFMREGYMTPPMESDGRDGVFFVFGKTDHADPLTYPAVNTMQKAFHRILQSGRRLQSGAIFFLTDQLDHFGTQFYRSHSRIRG